MTIRVRVFILLLITASAGLAGCGTSDTPVTPAAAEQAPTSDAPLGEEPVLPEEGP